MQLFSSVLQLTAMPTAICCMWVHGTFSLGRRFALSECCLVFQCLHCVVCLLLTGFCVHSDDVFYNQAGSVHVRVRRDADEQMVLAHVYNRLANLVSVLTVQIFKDDWSRPSAFQILGDASLLSKTTEPRPSLTASAVSGVPSSGTLPYLTGMQFVGSASYRTAGPLVTGSERPEARQFISGHNVAGSMLTSHAGVRFPPIQHYTDISSPTAKYSASGSVQGYMGSTLQSVPEEPDDKVPADKHK